MAHHPYPVSHGANNREHTLKIVLHICCGVCAAGVVQTLTQEGHEVTGFFYNPNIQPEEEYQKRLEAVRKVAQELGFPLAVASYDAEAWLQETEHLKHEPEGGERCSICFKIRLEKTFSYLKNSSADAFTTTLTISPHKSARIVNRFGQEIGGDQFLARDFKKKEGFKKAIQQARQWGLYQQNYCGCVYSIRRTE
jgi:predicted adenine nucleotide alpha hydrolase (AANH) superfamily ATPase